MESELKYLDACGSCLNLKYIRFIKDWYGEDVVLEGHPAQKNAYESLGLYITNADFGEEVANRLRGYWLPTIFISNESLPKSEIFVRLPNGLHKAIRNLAIPSGYSI